MPIRDAALLDFLTSVDEALATRALGPEATAAMSRIYGALALPGPTGPGKARRLPVCAHLPGALETARAHSAPIARIADAFAAIEPSLFWTSRTAGGPHASANWAAGHANAMIVGPNGLESRDNLHVGVSLLAPHVRYPDHNHGPEEVYLVLSPGRFQHGDSGWFEPGIGGTLYNKPSVKHAMASDDLPLIALWCLWIAPDRRSPESAATNGSRD